VSARQRCVGGLAENWKDLWLAIAKQALKSAAKCMNAGELVVT
jgi:hypothetical protein